MIAPIEECRLVLVNQGRQCPRSLKASQHMSTSRLQHVAECKRCAAMTLRPKCRCGARCTRWGTGSAYIAKTCQAPLTSCFHVTGRSFWSTAASGMVTKNASAQRARQQRQHLGGQNRGQSPTRSAEPRRPQCIRLGRVGGVGMRGE